MALLDALLFVVAATALGGAGWRAAGACGTDGLARTLGAAALATAAATLQALGAGLAGLAGTPVVLAAMALATWLAAARLLPARGGPPVAAMRTGWRALTPRAQLATGAALASVLGWAGWQVQHPNLGFDGLVYHANIAALWAQRGDTGAVLDVAHGLPVGSYPLAGEASLAWALGLSRALVLCSLWNVALWLLAVAAALTGLRALGTGARERRVAAVALGTLPIVVDQLRGPYSDLAALAWLATCAALCAVARAGAPGALVPALPAAGLATGAKTTAALFALGALALAAWPLRPWRRHMQRPFPAVRALWPAAAAAAVLGGLWPVRNLIAHGAPLWPLSSAPGGDPVPAAFRVVDARFADHAGDLLGRYLGHYADVLGGGWLVLGGAILLPLARRRRAPLLATAATLAGLALWALAPYTGAARADLAAGATRYALPTLAVAVLAIALCGRAGAVLLAASVLVSADAIARTFGGDPGTPPAASLLFVAALGALLAQLWRRRPRRARVAPRAAWGAAAVLAAVWLSAVAGGYARRHETAFARVVHTQRTVTAAIVLDPGFTRDTRPVSMFPLTLAVLAGDRLEHSLAKLPDGASCGLVRDRVTRGWVMLRDDPASARLRACLAGRPATGQGSGWFAYR